MTENIVTGKKYRICTDATRDTWDRVSFWTKASDVYCDDGTTAEHTKTRAQAAIEKAGRRVNPSAIAYHEDGTTFSRAYGANDFFVWAVPDGDPNGYNEGFLMNTTRAVAKGETITNGVNCSSAGIIGLLNRMRVYVGSDGKLHYVNVWGADTALNFSARKQYGWALSGSHAQIDFSRSETEGYRTLQIQKDPGVTTVRVFYEGTEILYVNNNTKSETYTFDLVNKYPNGFHVGMYSDGGSYLHFTFIP